ncbi:ABC-2 type transport system ATP-binding protein [Paenibacillus turicensis]|uniref:ABC-2 type transport system ATP-binding protein n=1 Tax=Paenibacillus turicensis TaxID=160487 RepID=A0ABS4FYN1_9BACL|nr:ABC transporter ATP-binding protein [Paenibacillus turicensis]MBP1907686.1 ABC-2 type transport system ATP-binding protein [Paenibacillus turicensis]
MLLNLKDVSIRYHKANKNAVTGVSLSIEENSIVSIVGHNGAGKSTLIQAIMQNLNYAGSITYGFDKYELYKYIRVQTQTSTFEKNAKVKDIIQLYIELLDSQETVDELLQSVQMLPFKNAYLEKLSGGEKQKVAVLLATIGNPKLIILDELTTGLDVMSRRMIWDLLNKIRKEKGVSILLTSHFLDEVEYLSDYVIVMEQGTIKLQGTVRDIIDNAFAKQKLATCLVDSSFRFTTLKYAYKQQSNKLMIEYKEDYEKDVFDNLKICGGYDIQLQQRTFEDAFLKVIGYELDEKGETKS